MTRSHASGTSAARRSDAGSASAASTTAGSWPWPRRRCSAATAASRSRARAIATRSWATRTIRSGREISSPAAAPGRPLPSQRSSSCPSASATASGMCRRRASSVAPSHRFAPISSKRCWPPSEHLRDEPRRARAAAGRRRTASGSAAGPPWARETAPSCCAPRWKPMSSPPTQLAKYGAAPGAADVRDERDVVRPPSAPASEQPSRVGQLQRRQADRELVLERLPETEIGRQRQRRHELRQADAIVGAGRLHVASLDREPRSRRGAVQPIARRRSYSRAREASGPRGALAPHGRDGGQDDSSVAEDDPVVASAFGDVGDLAVTGERVDLTSEAEAQAQFRLRSRILTDEAHHRRWRGERRDPLAR